MANGQNIGGVDYGDGVVKNYTAEQKTRRNENGKVEAYTEYSVWLNDGTKLEYSKEQNGASVTQKNGETIFSSFNGGYITDTPRNDKYTLEGCQDMLVDAWREETTSIFRPNKPIDSDRIIVKDKINPDGTITESKNNAFELNKGDKIQLQEDYEPQETGTSYYRQRNAREASNLEKEF